MHFWIDKRSQGCGFNRRHLVPPSLSGYGHNQRHLRAGFHHKPMVTPVHRFQSIESVANNSLRHTRSSNYRLPTHCHLSSHCSGTPTTVRTATRSIDTIISPGSSSRHRPASRTKKLTYGVWLFLSLVSFILVGAEYYFRGYMGIEAVTFCTLMVIFLILGGLVSLCESMNNPRHARGGSNILERHVEEAIHGDRDDEDIHPPITVAPPPPPLEAPPPPYHIAVMLPSHNHEEAVQIIRDSPPPSYEKAVK